MCAAIATEIQIEANRSEVEAITEWRRIFHAHYEQLD
jgi:hypothetical protein